MPKLNRFNVKVETGESGCSGPVLFSINGHSVAFENVQGGTGPGEVFEGDYEVGSFAHSLALVGPKEGKWDIKQISVDLNCESTPPYSIKFGKVELDETTELDIWQDPPLPTFSV